MSTSNKIVPINKKVGGESQQIKPKVKRTHRETSHQTTSARKKLFCDVIERLAEYNLADVSKNSGVSYTTLYNWCFGETVSPILRTILDVCEVIDLEVVLVDTYSVQKTSRATKKKAASAISR